MRFLPILILLMACATPKAPKKIQKPSWVEGVRSGEEKLKVTNGKKLYFRRIAGSAAVTKETACNLAIYKAEEDIRREFPNMPRVAYSVEVLYYDPEHHDCATTVSTSAQYEKSAKDSLMMEELSLIRRDELYKKDYVTEEEAGEILLIRSEMAIKYALVGMTKVDFKKFTKDELHMQQGPGLCHRAFKTFSYSMHGTTQVCWSGENVLGYCTSKENQCWTRSP